ncbi:MAG: GTPase Era [Candidatus Sericytochromatia bacterium]|nr:GTPase Era [Candidatus Tanganyikabacteria bacterium]
MTEPSFRAGFVALVGRPNVGKSTLVNRFAGQKIAAVSAKPQTTRHQIRGIVARPHAQVVFVDTPGIHKPLHLLGETLVKQAREALSSVDAVVFMVDANEAPGPGDRFVADMVAASGRPAVLALNKIDRRKFKLEYQQAYEALGTWVDTVGISAQRGNNCEKLLRRLEPLLPEGPALFPEDEITDQTLRQIAGELVREQVLRQTEEEVPHAVAVRIESWTEREDGLVQIAATLFVERDSQKGILIGEKGTRLREVGSKARAEIEKLLGARVFLELWVKVMPHWRREKAALKKLGYVVD